MVAIGVTGHRFLTELDKLASGVDEALCRIERAFPGQLITVISPLAEGADRLVVHRVLSHPGARLVVPLPLPEPEYMADFESTESREEFSRLLGKADKVVAPSPNSTRSRAYVAVGRYVLDHCDVLIALWDGRTAQGRGGAGEIVAEARRRGLPLAWVRAGNRVSGTEEPISLGDRQGKVSFERFPD